MLNRHYRSLPNSKSFFWNLVCIMYQPTASLFLECHRGFNPEDAHTAVDINNVQQPQPTLNANTVTASWFRFPAECTCVRFSDHKVWLSHHAHPSSTALRLPRHEVVSSSSEHRVKEPHTDCRSATSSVTQPCVGSVSRTTALRLVSIATSQAFKLTQASGSPLSLQHFR